MRDADPLIIAAVMKTKEANLIVSRLPSKEQAFDATKLDARAAKNNEDVKS